MSSQISFAQVQNLVLNNLELAKSQLPVNMWNEKRYILDSWVNLSILELINEVKTGTPLGRQYVLSEANRLGFTVIG